MQLVLAIIQDADASALLRALQAHEFDVTKLASSGGFLREGNTTLMLGVQRERLEHLKQVIRETCQSRTRVVASRTARAEYGENESPDQLAVKVGGAALFVVSVEEFIKY